MKTEFWLRIFLILTLSLSSVSLTACSTAVKEGGKYIAKKAAQEGVKQGAKQLVKKAASVVAKTASSKIVKFAAGTAATILAWKIVERPVVAARINDAIDSVISPSDAQLSSGTQVFNAESGVFSMRLDPIFQKQANEHDAENYTHLLVSQDKTTRLVINFSLVSDVALSDSEWIEYLKGLTSDFPSDFAIPPEATQIHGILISTLSQRNDRLEWWIEESGGVAATLLYSTPMSRWETNNKQIRSYLRSFTWKPSTVREFLSTGP
jgi:hypothetical protein